jgi:hypothetical protein
LQQWLAGLVLGIVPTFLAQTKYKAVKVGFFSGPALTYNPYYWNPWNKVFWAWHPTWLIIWVQIATIGAIVALILAAYRTKKPIDFLAPFTFLVACKATVQAQFWYLILLPSFLVPVRHRRIRAVALVAIIALEPVSAVQIVSGPFGYTVGDYYGTTTPYEADGVGLGYRLSRMMVPTAVDDAAHDKAVDFFHLSPSAPRIISHITSSIASAPASAGTREGDP